MPQVSTNGLYLEYESFGRASDPAMLLVMGLGAQMILWPDPLCHALADAGFHVIRFDNRDVGLSTKLEQAGKPRLMRAALASMVGLPVRAPYTLRDMAHDTLGLMDGLGLRKVHLVGASMGGMISHMVAANHPQRVQSLVSIMSTSGNPKLPMPSLKIRMRLVKRPNTLDRESLIRHSMQTWRMIGSPGYPAGEDALRAKVERMFDRALYPRGLARQTAAVLASGSHLPLMRKIVAPTLIIHGREDPLVRVEAAHEQAEHIRGSRLVVIPGMGHDLPPELLPQIAKLIVEHAQRSGTAAAAVAERKQA